MDKNGIRCATCIWHQEDEHGDEVCCNGASDFAADRTSASAGCEAWEGARDE